MFSAPLPTSMASTSEYVEIELRRPVDLPTFERLLREAMPDELPIYEAIEVPWKTPPLQERTTAYTYAVGAPDDEWDAITARLASFAAGVDTAITVERKGKTRTIDLTDVVLDLRSPERGLLHLEVKARGAGARIRDVLRGIFGEGPAVLLPGWSVSRVHSAMSDALPQPPSPPLEAQL